MSSVPTSRATRAPLFDRLMDADADGRTDVAHVISGAELRASLARELASLLNTRIDPAIDAIDPRERTVLEYGLPDFTALAAQSNGDTTRLALAAQRAILAFEPRLGRPRVDVIVERTKRDSVAFLVSGMLVVNGVAEPVTFPVELGASGENGDAG
ncbi:MAG TPA: type VI secretion system baseplate subunit TssE [Gemmatimonadaceae bacterium]|nr:type VI secretion system baseplate subunit TssE [Gemmatimonadaceae bacterium]